MRVIGITGGVATGKSTFTLKLQALTGAEVFDADKTAHSLLERRDIIGHVEQALAVDLKGNRTAVRAKLREVAFQDEQKRRVLESIIHPEVLAAFSEAAARRREFAKAGCNWLLADIPLLLEVGAEIHCDIVVVVACTRSTQKHRLVSTRKLSPGVADQMIASQFSIEEKMRRADCIVWSECAMAVFEEQARVMAARLEKTDNV